MKLFDSHCHLQDPRLSARLPAYINEARGAGVCRWVCCGTHQNDWAQTASIAKLHHGVAPAFGLHPWFVDKARRGWLKELSGFLDDMKSSVGEIGLDHALLNRNDADQAVAFIAQLRLARDLNKPVSIHCRKAWGALLDILNKEGGLPHGGVIHSYSGSADLVPVLEKLGAYISFSGSVTRTNNKRVQKACAAVSSDRILIETDAPDIPPEGIQDINQPENITYVMAACAKIRRISNKNLSDLTYENSIRLFDNI